MRGLKNTDSVTATKSNLIKKVCASLMSYHICN